MSIVSKSNKARNPKADGRCKQIVEHAPDGAAQLQQEMAQCGKAGVIIVSHRPRLLDWDNLVTSGKPVLDSLRYAGYLREDDPESVLVWYKQYKCKSADERTEIYIFPLQ